MRKACLLSLIMVLACTSSPQSGEDKGLLEASQAAERNYQHLLAGRYNDFLNGRAGADSMPSAYREQLITAYQEFMAQQRLSHGGLLSLQVSNARRDSTLGGLMQVFLVLSYADGTQEEIVVPMVEHNGEWKMK